MKIGFTVSDVQDFHLYSYLVDFYIDKKENVILLYDNVVDKITSPKNNKKILNSFQCDKIKYSSMKECIDLSSEMDLVITNEGQPFQGNIKVNSKIIGLSWTMEYYVHGPRFLNLVDRFYVDCSYNQLFKTYDLSQYNVIYNKHPKYYILNNKNKENICEQLSIDSNKKYVTFLGPAPAQKIDKKIKDMYALGNLFKEMGYTIIIKQKPKCPKLTEICNYDIKFLHKHPKYSTSAMLSYISDFVVGFNTSGVVESARINTPFINLYLDHKTCNYRKHPVSKLIYDKLLRIENFDKKIVSKFIEEHQNSVKNTDFEIDSFFKDCK